jgi:hypothetical protein
LLVKEPALEGARCRLFAEVGFMQIKTRRVLLTPALKLAVHGTMGVAMGLALALILTLADLSGIMTLIDQSATPGVTLAMFVGTIILTFAIGATLTGLVFMTMEDS